jgi:glutaconyl-CoA/methylmalonyl-CoA decarboxylase subunit delta
MSIFARFINPESIGQISVSEKIIISLFLTVMGMIITFIVLAVVCWLTMLLSRVCRKKQLSETMITPAAIPDHFQQGIWKEDETIIAVVISAAIAAGMGPTSQHLRIRKITPTFDQTPQWGRVGRIEQLLEGVPQ